jgi:hypothetical protein
VVFVTDGGVAPRLAGIPARAFAHVRENEARRRRTSRFCKKRRGPPRRAAMPYRSAIKASAFPCPLISRPSTRSQYPIARRSSSSAARPATGTPRSSAAASLSRRGSASRSATDRSARNASSAGLTRRRIVRSFPPALRSPRVFTRRIDSQPRMMISIASGLTP